MIILINGPRPIPLQGVPIDAMEGASGDTALLLACRLGFDEIVDLCLELGE
jgi:ankyrin repeat protein